MNPPQRGFHAAEQDGLTIYIPYRQIPLRGVLYFVHLVRALLNCDAVPPSQYLNQLGLFSFEDLFNPAHSGRYYLHSHPCARAGRPRFLARDGPEPELLHLEDTAAEPAGGSRRSTRVGMQYLHWSATVAAAPVALPQSMAAGGGGHERAFTHPEEAVRQTKVTTTPPGGSHDTT